MIETDVPYMGFQSCCEAYYQCELGHDAFQQLSSKKKKRYLKCTYPNLPSSLPLLLERILTLINEGRNQRNQPLLTLHELETITTQNAQHFFGFSKENLL